MLSSFEKTGLSTKVTSDLHTQTKEIPRDQDSVQEKPTHAKTLAHKLDSYIPDYDGQRWLPSSSSCSPTGYHAHIQGEHASYVSSEEDCMQVLVPANQMPGPSLRREDRIMTIKPKSFLQPVSSSLFSHLFSNDYSLGSKCASLPPQQTSFRSALLRDPPPPISTSSKWPEDKYIAVDDGLPCQPLNSSSAVQSLDSSRPQMVLTFITSMMDPNIRSLLLLFGMVPPILIKERI